MKNGNNMKSYIIIRSHDSKIMAKVTGYIFANELCNFYSDRFKNNKFYLSDKNNKENGKPRIKNS